MAERERSIKHLPSNRLGNISLLVRNLNYADLTSATKDNLYVWWKQVEQVASWIEKLKGASVSEKLPKLEKKELSKLIKEPILLYEKINLEILDFAQNIPPANFPQAFAKTIKEQLGNSPEKEQALEIDRLIDDFYEDHKTPFLNQVLALSEAIIETRDINEDETEIRQKIAQSGFEELVNLMAYRKLNYMYDIGNDPSTIDDLEVEKMELISALNSQLWDTIERRRARKSFKSLRKLMDIYNFETKTKVNFNFIFKAALGKVSKRNSAIELLRRVEEVWELIAEDDTLIDAWDWEVERLEEIE